MGPPAAAMPPEHDFCSQPEAKFLTRGTISELEEWVVFCTWLPQTIPLSSSESDFEVRVYYRGRLVLADVFKNVRGLRFVPPGSQGHYPDLADVVLPDPVCLNDSLQVTYTQRLLRGVAPGVVLRIEGITLCGMRQGHCHVSWSQSEMPEDETPHGALLKEQLGPIYSLQQFVQDLVGYMEGRQGSPKYTLWLCFGEDWPDTRRPWKKKLLMVEVSTSVPFHALLNMFLGGVCELEWKEDLEINSATVVAWNMSSCTILLLFIPNLVWI
uniref:Interferon regulatory factor 3 n=1 Tax=Podarcis muralis TaxID=64176 RepID=A0A670IWR9_PODMU